MLNRVISATIPAVDINPNQNKIPTKIKFRIPYDIYFKNFFYFSLKKLFQIFMVKEKLKKNILIL